jgi:hypothetical protein
MYRRKLSLESEIAWRTQFKAQRKLYQRKFVEYWSVAIDSCHRDGKALWSKLRPLLKPYVIDASKLTADDHAQYFTSKIEGIRASTASSTSPNIEDRQVREVLSEFQPATVEEITSILQRSAPKQCKLDPVPTWLIKRAAHVIAPVITGMCNASFMQVKFPDRCKKAIVRPLLKKKTLDPNDPSSYRPISNLSFVSKVVEKVVDARLTEHSNKFELFPVFQSAYRPHHSTETAVVCILDGMIRAVDQGHVGAMMMMDMSAAFDTVDHIILMDVLRRRFGVEGNALSWLAEFLNGRTQVVSAGQKESDSTTLFFGLPQGSVLGPKSFIQYAEDAASIWEQHQLCHHFYADDMQGYSHGKPSDAHIIVSTIERCAADVSTWCASKRLQLNGNKTEVMWFGTPAGLRKIPPQAGSIHVDHSVVEPVSAVRDLGVIVDAELTMQEHVNRTAQTCFYHLRRLRSVRQQLGRDVTAQLVSALVLSRLDYCNAVLADLPASTLAPFQKVLHAAARLVLGLRPRDHVSSALKELHWLPIMQRIQYKLCLFVHKASIGQAPKYIIDLLTANADVPSKSSLRSSDSGNYVLPRTRTKLGHRAFSVAAPRAWNCLPTELKLQRSTTVFRRDLKTFLFKAAYG